MAVENSVVVVGIPPMGAHHDALEWAACEAELRGAGLHAVHCPATATDRRPPELRAALERLHEGHPGLHVTTTVSAEPPAQALLRVADGADLIVVGAPGPGGLSHMIGESTALRVAMHAGRPVAVVPSGDAAERGGPVVVGINGSHASSAALQVAFAEARTRQRTLVVVGIKEADEPESMLDRWEQELLVSELGPWHHLNPEVHLEPRVVRGRPTTVLLTAAKDAALLVIGSRSRTGYLGLGAESASTAILQNSPAPVIVAR